MPVHIKRRRGIPKINAGQFRYRAQRLMKLLEIDDKELSILLTDDIEMTALNNSFRKRNRTTDVLAFSQLEGDRGDLHQDILGDVVISVAQAKRQAKKRGLTLSQELTVLLVHGTLHLVGYEHVGVGRRAAASMRREQDNLVAILDGQKRP